MKHPGSNMTSNVKSTNFSSFYDKYSDSLAGNDLDQLDQDTNIVKITCDETSSLESIVLNNGPFQFNSQTYLNDTIKIYFSNLDPSTIKISDLKNL